MSAFNNAGSALYSDNLIGFVTDPWICVPLSLAVIVGGLGFPSWPSSTTAGSRPSNWTVHTRLTLYGSALLIVIGTLTILGFEWTNDGTMGDLSTEGKVLAGFVAGVMPRSAGFNSIDYTQITLRPSWSRMC